MTAVDEGLTRRRAVDLCRVDSCLCPGVARAA
ncbi:putative leader peptide [Actinomycetospora sp. TBRC 11914]